MISHSLKDTRKAAKHLVKALLEKGQGDGATVVALTGNLGAGKTTFTQQVGELLGIDELMQSPTFIIERRYPLQDHPFETLLHVDAYRIEDIRELDALRFKDDLEDPANLILIEWANLIADILPDDTIHVVFSHEGPEARGIKIEGIDA